LKTTIKKVILRGGLYSLMPNGKPSAVLNGLIEQATYDGYKLLRPQITACELLHSDLSDAAIELTRYPLPDKELVRSAKCVADKVVKSQKIISQRSERKRDEAGNLLREPNGRLQRKYKCVDLRIEHPTQARDEDGKPLRGEWTDHRDGQVSGMDGRPIRTTNYAYAADNAMVAECQRSLFLEVIAGYLGQEQAEWLLDYTNGRYPTTPESDEVAAFLREQLMPYIKELEGFRDLLT